MVAKNHHHVFGSPVVPSPPGLRYKRKKRRSQGTLSRGALCHVQTRSLGVEHRWGGETFLGWKTLRSWEGNQIVSSTTHVLTNSCFEFFFASYDYVFVNNSEQRHKHNFLMLWSWGYTNSGLFFWRLVGKKRLIFFSLLPYSVGFRITIFFFGSMVFMITSKGVVSPFLQSMVQPVEFEG